MRVILEPLIGDMPLVGALSIFFLRKPVSQGSGCSYIPLHWGERAPKGEAALSLAHFCLPFLRVSLVRAHTRLDPDGWLHFLG